MPGKHEEEDYVQVQAPVQPEYYAGRAPGTYGAVPVPPNTRIQYDETFYQLPTASASNLYPNDRQVSPFRDRPRSQPPPSRRRRADRELRDLRDMKDEAVSRVEEDLRHPVDRAKRAIDHTFSNSNSGLGVGVLGAIVGGLIAREASAASASRSRSHGGGHHHRGRDDKTPLISTVLGAAVGGLAANALEKRIEVGRMRTAEDEDAWERKWGRDSRGRKIDRYEEFDDRGRRLSRRKSSGMLYDDFADDGAAYGRPGR